MAFTSGTASDYKDLLSTMVTFASANGWTVLEQSSTDVYLKGEGTSGLDEIYVGISTYANTTSSIYNWRLHGAWGYRSGRDYTAMPKSSSAVSAYLWENSIPYWMVADASRIIVVAKISTVYQFIYLGFLDISQVATSNQYPYPLLVGGCGASESINYSATSGNSAFWADQSNPSGRLCLPDGYWSDVDCDDDDQVTAVSEQMSKSSYVMASSGGIYLPERIYLAHNNSRRGIYGSLNGIYRISGQDLSAESVVTVGSSTYRVFPNVYRVTRGNFCCLRCE